MPDELREDVALANHIVHRMGLVTAFGHVSARIPGTSTFLFPTRASPALARVDRLLTLDFDGQLVAAEGEPNTELWIHARIYAARPDVGAVAHVHSPACVALAQIGQPLSIIHNSAAIFSDGVPLYDRAGLIRSRELGDEVAARLGAWLRVLSRRGLSHLLGRPRVALGHFRLDWLDAVDHCIQIVVGHAKTLENADERVAVLGRERFRPASRELDARDGVISATNA